MANTIDYHHWQYFLALENDLINVSRYIEFSGVDNPKAINARVHSLELARILLMASAECEVILKIITAPRDPQGKVIDKDDKRGIDAIKQDLKATPTQDTPTQDTPINENNDFRGIYNSLINATIIIPVYNL